MSIQALLTPLTSGGDRDYVLDAARTARERLHGLLDREAPGDERPKGVGPLPHKNPKMIDRRLEAMRRRIDAAYDRLIVQHHAAHDLVGVDRDWWFVSGNACKDEHRIRSEILEDLECECRRACRLVHNIDGTG